jgi:hypothetical protein
MGHTRLGKIPKSQAWSAVVETMAISGNAGSPAFKDNVALVAKRTLEAAQGGLDRLAEDRGLRFTFYLLAQVALAARTKEWQHHLAQVGLGLDGDATSFDLTAAFQARVDDFLAGEQGSTDISEIAQRAAGEALSEMLGKRSGSLFGDTGEELRLAVQALSSKSGFAELGQTFFGRLMTHYLNFYLSRISAASLGGNAFQQLGDISHFNSALEHHCFQSALIIRDFCGEWYSKTEFQQGINLQNSTGFVAVAVRKLQAELRQQAIGQ